MTGRAAKCDTSDVRDGEIRSPRDPALETGDAQVTFIGRIRSPWNQRSECPKNMRQARDRAAGNCRLEIDACWRPGLTGLKAGDYLHMLYWMHEARRDIVLQQPRHRDTPTGVFALRSPVRPNPIAMALVKITSIDADTGIIRIDATDALDQTPLVDLKPYLPSTDHPPDD